MIGKQVETFGTLPKIQETLQIEFSYCRVANYLTTFQAYLLK